MKVKICAPRIFVSLLLAALLLLGGTSAVAHNTEDSEMTDPTAAPLLQAGVGKAAQLEGELEIVHQDFRDGHGEFVFTLKQADGTRVPLRFAKHAPTDLITGDHIRANGRLLNGSLLLYSGSANVKQSGGGTSSAGTTTSSIPVLNTFGTQSVLIILVNFQDSPTQPFTTAQAEDMFFNRANTFFAENSYSQTSIAGTVVGWFTIPDSITTCNVSQIAIDAQNAAAAAGTTLSNYTRYVYAFPYNTTCGWAGSSYVGGNPSQSWINGNNLDAHVVNHELGHAFGLWHSHLLDCGTNATICSTGNVVEYGDPLDVMGTVQTPPPDYNAFQKERLGWLNYGASPSIQTVTTSGTYIINPYELGGPGPNALKILKFTDATTGAKTWYYIEARQGLGFDSFLPDGSCSICYVQNETTGVLFHIGTDGNGNSSELLDMTPSTPTTTGWFDPSLVVGQSFQDSAAGMTFTPISVNNTGATVQIMLNGSSCTRANPRVSVSPSQSQAVSSGTPVSFTVTITDKDSSSCDPATFNFSGAVPSGWAGVFSTASLSLSPGGSGSGTLSVTAPAGTVDGSYGLSVTATNASAGSYYGSATGSYVISSAPLAVTLSTNQPSYLPGQTVGVIVTMLFGTSPDVGASVMVTVITPNGKTATLSGTTGSNGVALLNYRLSKGAATGTYQVQFGSTLSRTSSAAVSSAAVSSTPNPSTSFTVQYK